ncbi:myeloid cell surface antigen CD33-like [Rhinoraja longicauda]
MIGILFLSLLQAASSEDWEFSAPREVRAQRGLCAKIPCNYSYPKRFARAHRTGMWINDQEWKRKSIAFCSDKPSQAKPRFRSRTHLSGSLEEGDCSLIIDDILREDEGPYFFRVQFDGKNPHDYLPATWLHVSNFTEKPRIFPVEMVEGRPTYLKCTFATACQGTPPKLTWLTGGNASVSHSITQSGETMVLTSVLTLTPLEEYWGQDVTCRVAYPAVASEQTITVNMSDGRSQAWKVTLIIVGVLLIIALLGFLTYKYLQKRREKRPSEIKDGGVIYKPQAAINQDTEPLNAQKHGERDQVGKVDQIQAETLLYAQLQEMPAREAAVRPSQSTEYASIRFQ